MSPEEYIQLAEIHKEVLWKRRGIEWKIHFGLCASAAIITYYILQKKFDLTIVHIIIIFFAYIILSLLIINHQISIFISNYWDKQWQRFYQEMAECELTDLNRRPLRPVPFGSSVSSVKFIRCIKNDKRVFIADMSKVAFTFIIFILSFVFILIKWIAAA